MKTQLGVEPETLGSTTPVPAVGATSGRPIRTLRVDVTRGADSGRHLVGGKRTLSIGTADSNDLVLTDRSVSRYHVELARATDGILVRDLGSTNGTWSGPVRIDHGLVRAGSVLHLGHSVIQVADGREGRIPMSDDERFGRMVGRSDAMRELIAQLQAAVGAEITMLIVGESGTGKELAARAIHEAGPRADQPFVTVDCGGLPPTLVGSELFGHERGAFTGATQRHPGAFERAQGGTIFLDEIGELPLQLQATLLGVLERRTFRRVGGGEDLRVDAQIVTATNRDLRAEVNAGTFRLDLFYRVAGLIFQVPALRERPADIPLLIEHFLRAYGYEGPVAEVFSAEQMGLLERAKWKGNVRELRNLVQATLAIGEPPDLVANGFLTPGQKPEALFESVLGLPYKKARRSVLDVFELRFLADLLQRAGGNVSKAARDGKMDRSHLTQLLRKHGLR